MPTSAVRRTVRRTVRRGIPVAALVAAGLAVTACGPDGSVTGASAAPSAATSTSVAQDPGAASDAAGGGAGTAPTAAGGTGVRPDAAGSPSHTSGAAPTVPACATRNLKTTVSDINSGAGHTNFTLVFQNTGPAACTLRGYPGVSFVKAHNVQLGKAADRTPGPVTTVTLIPNAHAFADVESLNGQSGFSAAQCGLTTVPTLRVFPPNQTESTNIPWNTPECVGPSVQNLHVQPVRGNR
ncbi:DUF4232 domain-containing protein [Actinacidiphila acididurans]|uniref:DUF4232 domain-containing protein n=1 Tax=Actinacidiphila acididurans TaxID=2784346 RepID=A0ABS2U0H5_9ACTN|nr:DUF4232 domain-containing protein [Actinacidiphila acididurans]MBM9509094.1 DUF4232 domain-containing protein [Actinacidiphila acididurans]